MSLIKFIANSKHVTKNLTPSVIRFETRLVSLIKWIGPYISFSFSFWKPTFWPQCDKCKRMFVRDSPAPTVGQKFVGTDCPSVRSNGRNCRGKLKVNVCWQYYNFTFNAGLTNQDFVLDWEHELPETDLSLSDSHSVLADLSIVMGSTLQIIPAGVKNLN